LENTFRTGLSPSTAAFTIVGFIRRFIDPEQT
jgi:hypothetical protein